jgi:hypothetical protein
MNVDIKEKKKSKKKKENHHIRISRLEERSRRHTYFEI